MSIYRTAQGKSIDMSALVSRNERVRAVGNKSVNARGDTIDHSGKVLVPMTKKVSESYNNTIIEPDPIMSVQPDSFSPEVKPVIHEELLDHELDIEDDEDALEVEKTKSVSSTTDFVVKPASEAPEFFEPTPSQRKTKK